MPIINKTIAYGIPVGNQITNLPVQTKDSYSKRRYNSNNSTPKNNNT